MGLGERIPRIYLSVSYGAIRRKTTADDPKAVERELKDKSIIHERVYQFVQGNLENIRFWDDRDYGKSWTLDVRDGSELFAVKVMEDSRYGIDLLKKIPNLRKGSAYIFTPYDFEKDDGRRVGISIKKEGTDEKVPSYYQQFETGTDGKTKVKNLYGFPAFEGEWKDKDDVKIYFLKLAKFLRERAMTHLTTDFLADDATALVAAPEPEAEPGPV